MKTKFTQIIDYLEVSKFTSLSIERFINLGASMLLLFLSVSCVLEEADVIDSNLHNPKISKAKIWFEAQDLSVMSQKNQNYSTSRKNMPYLEKRPDWSLTKHHTNAAGQEVLEISLQFERSMISKYMLENFRNKKPRPHQISQNMLMVTKENGEYDIFILKIHSASDLSVNNRKQFFQKMNYGTVSKDFSGEMIISTIDEAPIKGWKVQEGKYLSRFKTIHDSGAKTLSTANLSTTCGTTEEEHCIVTSGWFYDEEFGWDYGSEITCTTFTQLECVDGEDGSQSPAKDDPDPLDGSGGGGSDPTPELEVEEDDFKIDIENLSQCHQLLINTLIGSTKEEFKKIFDKFAGNLPAPMNFNVEINYGDCGSGVTACTKPRLQNNTAIITLNEINNSSATDLSIGRTIMHETLHAYLLFVEQFPGEDKSLNALINAYIDKYGDRDLNPSHHNLFVEQAFIYDIAEELKNFATSLGYPLSTLQDHQFFMDMAWGGLHQTDVYQQMSGSEKDRIRDHYYAELNGENYLGTEPKGTKACEPSWQNSTIQ